MGDGDTTGQPSNGSPETDDAPNLEGDNMVADLRLDSENSHMPLRDRIRFAMMQQKRHSMMASAVSNANARQLARLKAAADLLHCMMESRTRYSEYMARLNCPQPSHFDAFMSIGDQIANAEECLTAIESELFENDCPPPSSIELAAIMQAYLGSIVDQSRHPHPSVLQLVGAPVV